jgi:hypothetical protein
MRQYAVGMLVTPYFLGASGLRLATTRSAGREGRQPFPFVRTFLCHLGFRHPRVPAESLCYRGTVPAIFNATFSTLFVRLVHPTPK